MTKRGGGEGVGRDDTTPRGKHTAGGSQARLAPTRSIQERLGSKRRITGEKRKRDTTTDTETYRGRDRKRKNSSRLDSNQGTSSMPLVRQERTLYERMQEGGQD